MHVEITPVVGKQPGFFSWVFGWGKSGSGSVQQTAKESVVNKQSGVIPVEHQSATIELVQSVHEASELARSLVAHAPRPLSEEAPEATPTEALLATSSHAETSQPVDSQGQQVLVEASILNELLARLNEIEALFPVQLETHQDSITTPVASANPAVATAALSSLSSKVAGLFSGIYANRYFLLSQLSIALLVLQFVYTSSQQEASTSENVLNTNSLEEASRTLLATLVAGLSTLKNLPLEVAVVLVLDVFALLSGVVYDVGHKGVSLLSRKKLASESVPGVNIASAKTAEEKKND